MVFVLSSISTSCVCSALTIAPTLTLNMVCLMPNLSIWQTRMSTPSRALMSTFFKTSTPLKAFWRMTQWSPPSWKWAATTIMGVLANSISMPSMPPRHACITPWATMRRQQSMLRTWLMPNRISRSRSRATLKKCADSLPIEKWSLDSTIAHCRKASTTSS